ncbi:hypothetical protein BDV38DRAFT_286146 [Aspergillus pseudotamarii]|uniref:DUF1918 domain-containing protein n=1 Tax=Aspergillus pseudotamarii TaxID=132259 RepID=A0A5N6SKA7_ASPPS|nr:uncharacterized protein BDV38DRAFT_286146 [Aspergillus pseudotamarii]KAE8134121.1 hypothetical protein BDV38DRAFT_286146 [Aspergillus pseudotamarii]
MEASVGDRIAIKTRNIGGGDQVAEIIEVRGPAGGPPYLVRFPDGHESVVFPGPDSEIIPGESD